MLVGTRPDALILMWDAFDRGQSYQCFIECNDVENISIGM